VLRQLLESARRFDLVLLDPPRTGAREALAGVVELAPRSIAICSCDPVTLARDLRELTARGYVLETVRGFDLFPQTHHVEAVAWMHRP
jgi:tRNA/tmRNA/rRNA uracil-C5-methylase (TrmA/RlmC/RlmD family)